MPDSCQPYSAVDFNHTDCKKKVLLLGPRAHLVSCKLSVLFYSSPADFFLFLFPRLFRIPGLHPQTGNLSRDGTILEQFLLRNSNYLGSFQMICSGKILISFFLE